MRTVQRFAPLLHVGNWGQAFWSWEEHVLTPTEYDRMLHRMVAFWEMGYSTITPKEAALARLEAR